MVINLNVIGERTEALPFTYTEDDVILYALGIGAGVDELDYVFEKNLKAFPTYAVIMPTPAMIVLGEKVKPNLAALLHGEQGLVVHKPIPPSGTFYTSGVCSAIYDKGDKGAVLNFELESRDEKGELCFENRVVIVDRSAGNFGGDRGPKSERLDPPQGKKPDFHVEFATSPNQAAIYRLSGDKNPIHIDPEFAKLASFDHPILHGLCSYGITGRAIIEGICGGDPARFKSFSARLMNVVFPGEMLITEGWEVSDGSYVIQTRTPDGRVVLGNARAEARS
ncbi:MaoC/PaaZ C-terminal domain-containing protein [Thermodesulfobacteriota bacterium]